MHEGSCWWQLRAGSNLSSQIPSSLLQQSGTGPSSSQTQVAAEAPLTHCTLTQRSTWGEGNVFPEARAAVGLGHMATHWQGRLGTQSFPSQEGLPAAPQDHGPACGIPSWTVLLLSVCSGNKPCPVYTGHLHLLCCRHLHCLASTLAALPCTVPAHAMLPPVALCATRLGG